MSSEYKLCLNCGETIFIWQSRWPSDFRRKTVCGSLCANQLRGKRQRQSRIERTNDMRDCGYGEEQIAKMLGIRPESLERYRFRDQRMGRTA